MQKLEKKTIGQIESEVERLSKSSREKMKEMYEVFEYLRTTKRFKENKAYKKSSFWTYLEDRFTIREKTFRENSRAFMKYPEESIEYGVGLVGKVHRSCGKSMVKPVFGQIKAEQEKKKRPLSRQKIEEIINRSGNMIKKTRMDWHAMYEAELFAHKNTREALREALKEIDEQRARIEKMKIALLEEVA